jgi:hypothetical protein
VKPDNKHFNLEILVPKCNTLRTTMRVCPARRLDVLNNFQGTKTHKRWTFRSPGDEFAPQMILDSLYFKNQIFMNYPLYSYKCTRHLKHY